MKAIQINAYGDPLEGLELVDIAEPPPPGPDEVLIGVEFAPVNHNDLLLFGGKFPVHPPLPSVVGNEGVGIVLAVGADVDNVKVGDRVTPPLYSFTWRERMVIPAADLFALPVDADIQQLAMLRINPPTAALLLSEFVDLKPGDWVVQNCANSGVGRAVIAIAKGRGLRTVNFVRRQEQVAEVEAAGGDIVLVDENDRPGGDDRKIQSFEHGTHFRLFDLERQISTVERIQPADNAFDIQRQLAQRHLYRQAHIAC